MGKKLNPQYRARMAERMTLAACRWCGRRTRRLVQTPEGGFHAVCLERYRAAIEHNKRVEAEQQAQKREAERALNMTVKDWWVQ